MDDLYATYNKKEIKTIISQAIEMEMWETRDNEEYWAPLRNLETKLYDMFEIFD